MKLDEGKDDGGEPKNDTAVVCVFFWSDDLSSILGEPQRADENFHTSSKREEFLIL